MSKKEDLINVSISANEKLVNWYLKLQIIGGVTVFILVFLGIAAGFLHIENSRKDFDKRRSSFFQRNEVFHNLDKYNGNFAKEMQKKIDEEKKKNR